MIGPIIEAFLLESIVMFPTIVCKLDLIGALPYPREESKLVALTALSANLPAVTDPSTGKNTPVLIPKSTTLNTEFESSAESNDIVFPLRVKLF